MKEFMVKKPIELDVINVEDGRTQTPEPTPEEVDESLIAIRNALDSVGGPIYQDLLGAELLDNEQAIEGVKSNVARTMASAGQDKTLAGIMGSIAKSRSAQAKSKSDSDAAMLKFLASKYSADQKLRGVENTSRSRRDVSKILAGTTTEKTQSRNLQEELKSINDIYNNRLVEITSNGIFGTQGDELRAEALRTRDNSILDARSRTYGKTVNPRVDSTDKLRELTNKLTDLTSRGNANPNMLKALRSLIQAEQDKATHAR